MFRPPQSLISFKENCCQVNVGHAVLCPTYKVDQVRQHDNQLDVNPFIFVWSNQAQVFILKHRRLDKAPRAQHLTMDYRRSRQPGGNFFFTLVTPYGRNIRTNPIGLKVLVH